MSVPSELPRKVIQDWRDWIGTGAATAGIDFLRHHKAPSISAGTPVEKFEAAVAWNAYQQALNDVENVLTELPKPAANLEEPGLND